MEKLIELTSKIEELINNQALNFGQAVFSPLYPATIQIHADSETTKLIQDTLKSELERYLGDIAKSINIHSVNNSDFDTAEKYSDTMIPNIESMLFTQKIFNDLTNILFFDIVQTSCFDSLEKFVNHFNICSEYRYDEPHPINKVLFLIADNKSPITQEILNYLHENNNSNYSSVVILSDQLRNGGLIKEDEPLRFKAIASLIALSNKDSNPRFYTRLFDPKHNIFTMGYIYQNKPVSMIAKYTVSSLIDCIMEKFNSLKTDTIKCDSIKKIYCPNTDFIIISKYFDNSRYFHDKYMSYFPSSGTADIQKTKKEMWKLFFEKNFRSNAIQNAKDVYSQIKDEFLKLLLQNFTYQQLSQPDSVKELEKFWNITKNNESEPELPQDNENSIYSVAINQTKIIYTNCIIDRLCKDINDIFETAKKMQAQLLTVNHNMQRILNTINRLPMSQSIEEYYKSQIVSRYVDNNWLDILNDFNKANDDTEIMNILEKHTEKIVDSNNIYAASFESELQARLDFAGAAAHAVFDIIDKNNRTVFMSFNKVGDEIQEICVVPANSNIAANLTAGGAANADKILKVSADQYIERVALFDAKFKQEYKDGIQTDNSTEV